MDNRGLKTSVVVSCIVVFILGIYLIYFYLNKDGTDINYHDNDKITENLIDLSNTDSNVVMLDKYVEAFNSNCSNINSLFNKGFLFKNIDNNLKLTTVLKLIENDYEYLSYLELDKKKNIITKDGIEYIKKEYKKVFNENIDIDNTGNCPGITKENNKYYQKVCTCATLSGGLVQHFIKAKKTDSEIKLYYKIGFYKYVKNKKFTSSVFSVDPDLNNVVDKRKIQSEDYEELNYQDYLDNNLDKFYTYIYTFKLKNNNYYFYSVSKDK